MKWSLFCHSMVTQFQFKDIKCSLPYVFIPHFVIYLSAISMCKQTNNTCILYRYWETSRSFTWVGSNIISTNDMGLETDGVCILEIHTYMYETYTLMYTMSINCIRMYRHLVVYLIQLHSYISSLKIGVTSQSHLHKFTLVGGPTFYLSQPSYTAQQKKYMMFRICEKYIYFFININGFQWDVW